MHVLVVVVVLVIVVVVVDLVVVVQYSGSASLYSSSDTADFSINHSQCFMCLCEVYKSQEQNAT